MKIYAVTKGEYSDYHICALTISKEKAEKLAKLYSDKWDDCDVEEYEDGEGEELRAFWRCDKNGHDSEPCDCNFAEHIATNIDTGEIRAVYVYAKDAAHAEKKAHDMLAEYKAKLAGIC